MTQRGDLAAVMDRMAIDEVVTGYAVAVDDGDWKAYRALFAPGGRADYTSAGGIEGPAGEVADWLAEALRRFPVRQHLVVNRLVRLEGEGSGWPAVRAQVRADFVNPMRMDAAGSAAAGDPAPHLVTAGRYSFALARSDRDGWRITRVAVHEKWRRLSA
ncbi:nuclear transport factor 2 family protein [Streptomyces sp. 2P-4]|uniref:nuclear transport factor 2 family protein n=1 Tax=Streptomyces sp. 2P-4 TaxID=2931974 RepID=UPI00253F9DE3|nr:nuclear transport factor 2 family protein [Streptomyces sp. 2P-4]